MNIKAVCKTGIHESVLSNSVIKNTVLKQVQKPKVFEKCTQHLSLDCILSTCFACVTISNRRFQLWRIDENIKDVNCVIFQKD